MTEKLIKETGIVVPGEILATGMGFVPTGGCFRENENVIASQLGLMSVSGRMIKVIPLSGTYVPKKDDVVIGIIAEVSYSNWFVNIGYANEAVLSMKDASSDFIERGAELSDYFGLKDMILTKVTNVTKSKAVDLSMKGPGLRKLVGGRLVQVTPVKVPRVVGKKGSMINMIKDATECIITVGQNGRIWIAGKDPVKEKLAADAIMLIEEKAHVPGLTEMVKKFLQEEKK
ncbi:MAG: exosome complex RNA-binding protein Rrp4 [Candidatus Woesearchaeota archaeon]